MSELLLDRAGRRRSPATMPGFHARRPPHNKGLRYPADPPNVEEIVAVMGAAGDDAHGRRLRGLIVILWRAGLRIQEALALSEADLDQRRGALLVRRGKGGRRREVGMDAWGWEQLQPWQRRVILLQGVEAGQSDPDNQFENSVRSLKDDQQRILELEARIDHVLLGLSDLEVRSPKRLIDQVMTRKQVDNLLDTSYRLRALGVGVGAMAPSQEVVIEIKKHSDGTLLVLPARAA